MKKSYLSKKQKKPISANTEFFRPYIFALKAGNQIQDNFLDYSLILLQVGHSEVLRTPNNALPGLFSHKFSR